MKSPKASVTHGGGVENVVTVSFHGSNFMDQAARADGVSINSKLARSPASDGYRRPANEHVESTAFRTYNRDRCQAQLTYPPTCCVPE